MKLSTRKRGACLAWVLAGVVGTIAACAVLAAGLAVYQSVSASAPASHLPTPASTYVTPGAVVEWKRATPTMEYPAVGSGGRAETSLSPALAYTPPPIIDAKTESAADLVDVGESLPRSQGQDTSRVRLPIDGPVTQGFGCSPFYTGIPGPGCSADAFWFHDGVDIAAPVGTPVQTGMAGTVIFAGPDGDGPLCNRGYQGYGLAVIVRGEGWEALYAHLSRIDVEVGQVVTPETPIGASGDTGCVSGAHLHFGLRHGAELVDPMKYIQ